MRIGEVQGDVAVIAAGGSEEVSGQNGMPLNEGDRVVAGEGGSAEVALDGGGIITVRENSDLKIENTALADGSFFLQAGSLLAKIQKLGDKQLRVRTPTAVAAVRGTEFGVEIEGEATHVGVFDEGKVEVSGETGEPETLISNQETSVFRGKTPVPAVHLLRFVRHRSLMRAHARRLAHIRARWATLDPAKRRELRASMLTRMRVHRLQMIEKRKRSLENKEAPGRGREMLLKRRKEMLENRRKMEERRNSIRRRQGP